MTAPDTVAALLAPAGPAALAALGIVGPGTEAALAKLFKPVGGRLAAGRPLYGWFGNAVRDDVVAVWEDAAPPRAEIFCHGGAAMAPALLAQLEAVGVPTVPWREHARRLGRTPWQCDAAEALAAATGAKAAAILLDQLDGALDRAAADPIAAAQALGWRRLGARLDRPFRVVLAGRPNAGKSSLLNALLGYPRAIVAAEAGTTRDVLRAETCLGGWAVELLDGAGVRDAAGDLEAVGIARLRTAWGAADLRVLVFDGSACGPGDSALALGPEPDLAVANKSDLPLGSHVPAAALRVSALTGVGVADLAAEISVRLVPAVPPAGAAVPFRPEHVAALRAAAGAMGR